MKEYLKKLEKLNIGKIETNVLLSKYTTYRVGGLARCIIYPRNTEKLIELLKFIKTNNLSYKILGNGSNLLFSDKPYEGILIKLDNFDDIEINDTKIIVGAGYSLMKLSMLACKKGLTGLEFAAGIPGTVGGAVYMNAGAYKSDMGYITKTVKVLTPKFKVIELGNKEMDFHYRTSFLQKNPGYICLGAIIKLERGEKKKIEEVIKDRRKRRVESQPLEYPSAGSVFRNPEGSFAGAMIEELGLKGLKKGGAQISYKHANFVINKNNASAEDIRGLILHAQEEVKKHYGVELKIEQEFVNWE